MSETPRTEPETPVPAAQTPQPPAEAPQPPAAAPAMSAEVPQPSAEVPGPPAHAPQPSAETTATPGSPAPAEKRPRPGRVAALAGTVLLIAAVVAGVGYTVVTVQGADRDPGDPIWKFPAAAKGDDRTEEASGLRGMLVPYSSKGYTRGPDLGEFGSDAVLSGREATELSKEAIKDLPRTERRLLEKEIDKQRIKGMVMRSYLNADSYAIYHKTAFSISVVLSQMESRAAVREMSTSQNEFLSALGVFRKGPKIEGHKNAKCFLTPKVDDEPLDRVICSAYSGDVLISATATGVRPLDMNAIAQFLDSQLDRIETPGKAI